LLPFLRDEKKQLALSVKYRVPDEKEPFTENVNDSDLHACAQDIIKSIESRNYKKLAEALKSAFFILDSKQDEEMAEGIQDKQE